MTDKAFGVKCSECGREVTDKGLEKILREALAEQPAQQQEPVMWVTVEKGVCASTISANFRHIPDGQYQLYAGPLQNDVVAAIATLKTLGYVYDESKTCREGEQWVAPQPAQQPESGCNPQDLCAGCKCKYAAQQEPVQSKWRDLALQFDAQRMSALAHLRAMIQDPSKHIEVAREFLAAAPQPAQRTWVGLTHEDKQHLNEVLNLQGRFPIIDAIEAKLMGKNT